MGGGGVKKQRKEGKGLTKRDTARQPAIPIHKLTLGRPHDLCDFLCGLYQIILPFVNMTV